MSNKDAGTIKLKVYDDESNRYVESGEEISTYQLVRALTLENFTKLFDDFLNLGGKQYAEGKEVGERLRFTHRTLQRSAVCFALGLIAGISQQEHTDPRNEQAIETAQKIKEMLDAGDFPLGAYL